MQDNLSNFLKEIAAGQKPNLAGRFMAQDLVAGDLFEKARKTDLRPGFTFIHESKLYLIIESGEEWHLVDRNRQYIGTILRCNSYKGFNVQVDVMGQNATTFIYFKNLKPIR